MTDTTEADPLSTEAERVALVAELVEVARASRGA